MRSRARSCRLLSESFTSTVAAWITRWNFPAAAVPRVIRNASPPEGLDARAKREEIVARTARLRPTQRHVEEVYGGEWEEAPDPPPMGGVPGEPEDPDETLTGGEGRRRDSIDAAVEELLADQGWEPLTDPVIEPLLAAASSALARSEDSRKFRSELPGLFGRMNDATLVQTLRRMGFSAALLGEVGLEENGCARNPQRAAGRGGRALPRQGAPRRVPLARRRRGRARPVVHRRTRPEHMAWHDTVLPVCLVERKDASYYTSLFWEREGSGIGCRRVSHRPGCLVGRFSGISYRQ